MSDFDYFAYTHLLQELRAMRKYPIYLGFGVSSLSVSSLYGSTEASTKDKRNYQVWSLSHVSLFFLSGGGVLVEIQEIHFENSFF